MTSQQLASPPSLPLAASFLPDQWLPDVEKKLLPGENVLSSVEVDLDAKLRFTKGILVVTDRRLLSRAPGEAEWREWSLPPRPAAQAPRPRRRRPPRTGRRAGPAGGLALHAGPEPAGDPRARPVPRAAGQPRQRPPGAARRAERLPELQGAARAGPGRMPDLHQGAVHAAVDLDPVPPVAFRQAVPRPAGAGLLPDGGQHRRAHDPAVPDHAADGQCADPVPERPAGRPEAGVAVHVGPARLGRAGLAAGLVRRPMCWRWCPSGWAPTCARPPTNTC